MYAPEVLDSFRNLAKTGQVEFLAETYAHRLASLEKQEEFFRQVRMHEQKIRNTLVLNPKHSEIQS
jgi:alpha-amylase